MRSAAFVRAPRVRHPERFSGRPRFETRDKPGEQKFPGEFVMLERFWYDHPIAGRIVLDEGFVTDFASTPGLLHMVRSLDPLRSGTYFGALPHDLCYCEQRFPRALCDQILWDALYDSGIEIATCDVYRAGVRVGGWWPWYKRIITQGRKGANADDFIDAATWAAYQARIAA